MNNRDVYSIYMDYVCVKIYYGITIPISWISVLISKYFYELAKKPVIRDIEKCGGEINYYTQLYEIYLCRFRGRVLPRIRPDLRSDFEKYYAEMSEQKFRQFLENCLGESKVEWDEQSLPKLRRRVNILCQVDLFFKKINVPWGWRVYYRIRHRMGALILLVKEGLRG